MPDALRYCFRFCCDPGFNDQIELPKLLAFCDEAHVDDVMVFVNVEEINTGHMDEAEQDIWLDLLERIKQPLDERGITLSGQPLAFADACRSRQTLPCGSAVSRDGRSLTATRSTTLRLPAGRVLRSSAHLRDMRLSRPIPSGWRTISVITTTTRSSGAAASVTSTCADFPRAPVKRLHERNLSRGITASTDEPSIYRQIWLDECRAGLEGAASAIERAVHAVDPAVKIGLMSSVPYVHSAEGRDWKSLLSAFAGASNLPVSRIHLPAYQELVPSVSASISHGKPRQPAAARAGHAGLSGVGELPYSRFSKSRTFTRFQLLSSLALNLSGMTIDLFDLRARHHRAGRLSADAARSQARTQCDAG
ncbi:MAG: hypothetical protein R2881_07685 [Eubacteriales bacterium]